MDSQQLLENIYFIMLCGGVTMLCVIAAIYLLFRKANAIAPEVTSSVRLRRWAAAFLLASAFSHVWWLLGVNHPLTKDPMVGYGFLCILDIVTVFPTMVGTLLAMLQDKQRPLWPFCLALIPTLILMVLYIVRQDQVYLTYIYVFALLLIVAFTLFMVYAVRSYGRWLQDNYADLEHKEIRKSLLVLAVFLIFFAMYEGSDTGPVVSYLLQVDLMVLTGLLLWRVETLQELIPDTPQELTSAPIPSNIGPLLKKNCEEAQLYLQHDLSLSQLAQTIGTNHTYLSKYFAQQGLTYNAYINGLRIQHFMRQYQAAASEQRITTAQKLAFESGFHSYSTFSATFKQNMGTTVTAWMRSVSD
jgi:AraC-like DNA-binding protein